ncbi:MAG: AAA family ATPase [Candidatus Magasanikbacteria bacterium]|nr:AAA family ATPase [Candidatus Magasanikbacteria bacterium]
MSKVDEQIRISDDAICKLINKLKADERGFLSQNILDKLRTFVEAVAVKASGEDDYSYVIYQNKAKLYVSSRADLRFLSKFHKFLQQTLSHYLPDEEKSERLMLKYYEYLLKIKSFLKNRYNFDVLENINNFPITVDSALKEYYEKIAEKINEPISKRKKSAYDDRYYIRKVKPFFVNNEVYYEITFTTAIDNVSKFDRVIAFTKLDILPNYAVKLATSDDVIEVLGKKMPIKIIDSWNVSIRPCELNHLADIFGEHPKISADSIESKELMSLLTKTCLNLVEVVEFSDEYYQRFKKNVVTTKVKGAHFFNVLDKCRELIKSDLAGCNMVRYLLYTLNNKVLKLQYNHETCALLSNLNLKFGCKPFDDMPFNTSPIGHNPKLRDLVDCIDPTSHKHELFARFIKNNTEQKGQLYTPLKNITSFEDVESLIGVYNKKLYYTHGNRKLENYKDHIYIKGYEEDTVHIIEKLKELSSSGFKNYSNSVNKWLQSDDHGVDCEEKKKIMKQIFESSRVAMIYGSAGTGKTKLITHISNFHKNQKKLYLANTNPAVNNLKRRVGVTNSTFQTVTSFLSKNNSNTECDLLVIDECSTVSNSDMLNVLKKASFKLLVLVGDIFQIESILFGNWFGIAESFFQKTSVFELTKPYRTKNEKLLTLWNKVRNIEGDILEHITNNNYNTPLSDSIFEHSEDDEIILCLNYDGLYGINNINRFLQGNNGNEPKQWGIHTYKVNDPILFNESNRFKPLIHNNLKGKILGIEILDGKVQFDIEIDESINELDTYGHELELLGESDNGKSVIRFFVNKLESTDEDEDSSRAVVPFQIAYAVSMHKAQGLEYNSVKVVITDETEEMITHNIFYTAITRAKEKLKIYWTPETEKKILDNLEKKFNNKDVQLLRAKFAL